MATGLIYKPGSGPCAETAVSVTGSCMGFKIPRGSRPRILMGTCPGPRTLSIMSLELCLQPGLWSLLKSCQNTPRA